MNRRTLLQAAGTASLTALAGCGGMLSNTESGSTTTTTQTQGAIEKASIDGTKLVVSLSPEADVDNRAEILSGLSGNLQYGNHSPTDHFHRDAGSAGFMAKAFHHSVLRPDDA